ncbi:uncharacterized protein RSE6_12263 [Rhynchosporium secalis]|uniref:Uncharacterized protein n=1 Tax=Rhynchosporium secalis TaxID=38038 RepID=A0A1E1MPY1_RHYSE|nr:uncharacterized protein RSE6_12263 [Rhynchosporium secalis]
MSTDEGWTTCSESEPEGEPVGRNEMQELLDKFRKKVSSRKPSRSGTSATKASIANKDTSRSEATAPGPKAPKKKYSKHQGKRPESTTQTESIVVSDIPTVQSSKPQAEIPKSDRFNGGLSASAFNTGVIPTVQSSKPQAELPKSDRFNGGLSASAFNTGATSAASSSTIDIQQLKSTVAVKQIPELPRELEAAYQHTINSQAAQLQECGQHHDHPLLSGTYKRKIREVTNELQKTRIKLDILQKNTKYIRETQEEIYASVDLVHRMLPNVGLPASTVGLIKHLGLQVKHFSSEVKRVMIEKHEAHLAYERNLTAESNAPGVRAEMNMLTAALERSEAQTKDLRETMLAHLRTFQETDLERFVNIISLENEITNLKAQVEQKDSCIKKKAAETADQAAQILLLTSDSEIARQNAAHQIVVATVATEKVESLSRVQRWMSTVARLIFLMLPWGLTLVPLSQAAGPPATEITQTQEIFTGTVMTWTYLILKFFANNVLRLDDELSATDINSPSNVSSTPSTNLHAGMPSITDPTISAVPAITSTTVTILPASESSNPSSSHTIVPTTNPTASANILAGAPSIAHSTFSTAPTTISTPSAILPCKTDSTCSSATSIVPTAISASSMNLPGGAPSTGSSGITVMPSVSSTPSTNLPAPTSSAQSMPLTSIPTVIAQRTKPTRAQDTQIRNKGKLVNKLEVSYGFSDHLPVDSSPVLQILRILSPAGISSVLQALFVFMVSISMLFIFTYSGLSNLHQATQLSVINQHSATTLLTPTFWAVTSGGSLTIIDLGDPDLWLKPRVVEDHTFEELEDEPEITILPFAAVEVPNGSNERMPVSNEPEPSTDIKVTWFKVLSKAAHVGVLGVALWRDWHHGARR